MDAAININVKWRETKRIIKPLHPFKTKLYLLHLKWRNSITVSSVLYTDGPSTSDFNFWPSCHCFRSIAACTCPRVPHQSWRGSPWQDVTASITHHTPGSSPAHIIYLRLVSTAAVTLSHVTKQMHTLAVMLRLRAVRGEVRPRAESQ